MRRRQLLVALNPFRQAEVGNSGLILVVDEHVRRLDVTMGHAFPVRMADRIGNLPHVARGLFGRHRPLANDLRKVLARDVLHGKVVVPVMLADVVDSNNVGVLQVGGRLGLNPKPPNITLVGQVAGKDHLDRHGPVETDLAGLVDDSHRTAGDFLQVLVVAELPQPQLVVALDQPRCIASGLLAGNSPVVVKSSAFVARFLLATAMISKSPPSEARQFSAKRAAWS